MERGQFSIEFIIVLGVLLTLLASISFPLYENSRDKAWKLTRLSQAREAANSLTNAVNMVYSGGVGARQTVRYSLPTNVWRIRINEDVDGASGIPADNRVDIQIWFNWEDDNFIIVDTLLPSTNHENWRGYPDVDASLSTNSGGHTITVEYKPQDDDHDNLWIEIREV